MVLTKEVDMRRANPADPPVAPGRTVAERLAHWRSLSWAQLVEQMKPENDEGAVPAARIEAPAVPARVIRD